MKNKILNTAFYLVFLFCFLPGCKETVESIIQGQNISGRGTISKYADDYTLITDDGDQYVPTNLPAELRIDNLRVEFKGIVEKNSNQNGINKIEFTQIKKI